VRLVPIILVVVLIAIVVLFVVASLGEVRL
jgi:hypothetical protein